MTTGRQQTFEIQQKSAAFLQYTEIQLRSYIHLYFYSTQFPSCYLTSFLINDVDW